MKYKSSFLNEACARGFFYQSTNLEGMDEYLTKKGRRGYVGTDLTAKSLHVGHLLPIFLMRLFQKHGHKPIIVVGGGTTKVGDPSFKNTARPLLSDEQIAENLAGITECLKMFLHFGSGENDALLVNNADWLDQLEYVPFLREVGRYFSVNRMLTFDSVKTKLTDNNTLSFLEFNYMIMQGYDFYELLRRYDCRIQFGGQDQWGNIVSGVEFIHKKIGEEVFGFTNPLLVKSNGEKMGKSLGGAVWLSPKLYSAYDFWQYWRNVDDADIIKLMYLFSAKEVEEIKKFEKLQGEELNDIKKMLADEMTALVHGEFALSEVHTAVANVFGGGNDISSINSLPKYIVKIDRLKEISIVDILVESKLCVSRGDAKKLIRNGGVYLKNQQITEDYDLAKNFSGETVMKLSCGKKRHILLCFE